MGDGVTLSPAAMAVIGTLLAALVTAIKMLFSHLMDAKDTQIKDMLGQRDTYRVLADKTLAMIEDEVNTRRILRNQPPIERLAAVLPEHHSPVTPAQAEAAILSTIRARQVAVSLELDQLLTQEERTARVKLQAVQAAAAATSSTEKAATSAAVTAAVAQDAANSAVETATAANVALEDAKKKQDDAVTEGGPHV